MSIPILEPNDNPKVHYHSSISQHKNKLSVIQQGEWIPISYDAMDAITCDGIIHHPEIVTDGDDIGFNYNVAEAHFFTNQYIYHDEHHTEIKELPEWFGKGLYEDFIDADSYINADNGALGSTNRYTLRIGTRYALAEETLKPEEF